MARLSVNDLNNLSGVSSSELDTLYDIYRKAHTKLFNDIENWVVKYESISAKLDKIAGTSADNDYKVYKRAKELYYVGSEILDNVDIFDEYTANYMSLLIKVKSSPNNVKVLNMLLLESKKKIINRLSECFGMYDEAYKRLCKEE